MQNTKMGNGYLSAYEVIEVFLRAEKVYRYRQIQI